MQRAQPNSRPRRAALQRGLAAALGLRRVAVGSSLVLSVLVACSSQEHAPYAPSNSGDTPLPSNGVPLDRCRLPSEHCPCSRPGASVECGELQGRVGEYVTCSRGQRVCGDDLRWGSCSAESISTKRAPASEAKPLALGDAGPCSPADPCNPLCSSFVDSGDGVSSAGENLCSVDGGLGLCPTCGTSGPQGALAIEELPAPWQPATRDCVTDDDCNFDTRCVDDRCESWAYPCHDTNGETCGGVDLVLGRPCQNPDGYQVQVCNRGYRRADSGTLRIGFSSDPSAVGSCAAATNSPPDSGTVEFQLGLEAGTFIDPGRCIDVNAGNSSDSGLDLSDVRGVFVNYDRGVAECNPCNNWNVLEPSTVCTGCTNLECFQDCSRTSLTGTVRDPAGLNPIPGVMVYVPNGEPAELAPGRVCERCESQFSGSPIASTVTRFDGTFSLENLPSNVPFKLVLQTGRWRRIVEVEPIARCATATLEPELSRLPRTQRRCVGDTCTGEGDIPQMALFLSDADPLQCLLRKIGIAESEFTTSNANGRVHLFNDNGMRMPGARSAVLGPDALLDDPAAMERYDAILAPCDSRHGHYSSRTRSGPNYNSFPEPTARPWQRANMRNYIDAGGRLFATHWRTVDFVHLNYFTPRVAQPNYTPFDSAELTSNVDWQFVDPFDFNPDAIVIHQFGDNVTRGGNTTEAADRGDGRPGPTGPSLTYTIDDSTQFGELFSNWANAAGASPDGAGTVTFDSWSQIINSVRIPAIQLAYGDSTQAPASRDAQACIAPCPDREWGGRHSAAFFFDAPLEVQSHEQCGRLMAAQAHVAEHPTCQILTETDECQDTGAGNPPDCSCLELPADDAALSARAAAWDAACGSSLDMTPQEKAFEFLIFNTTQCVGDVAPPPVQARSLPSATFVRDYVANCRPGESVTWRHFSWKAVVPTDTSVVFHAQTAATADELDGAERVWIGTADRTVSDWTSATETVDSLLHAHEPEQPSRSHLRVTMQFNPTGGLSPTLTEWRQVFDCTANE